MLYTDGVDASFRNRWNNATTTNSMDWIASCKYQPIAYELKDTANLHLKRLNIEKYDYIVKELAAAAFPQTQFSTS